MKKPTARAWVFIFGLTAGFSRWSGAAAAEPAGKQEVTRLIAELGNKQYRARQAAAQALERLGESALVLLQQAKQANDPEIRHRAEQLVEQIKREADTARMLEPKRVQLMARDRPVADVVADLAAKTGFSLKLAAADSDLADRKISVDTGETTFWQALDQLTEKAGLVDRRDHPRTLTWQDADSDLRRLRMQARLQMLQMQREGASLFGSSANESLTLISGSPVHFPTCYAGAVRIRAVPAPRDLSSHEGETIVLLEATPQPGLVWRGLVGDRIDLVQDEAGRKLTLVALTEGSGLAGAMVLQNRFLARRTEGDRTVADLRYRPLRLKLAGAPSHLLKELRGVLTAEVQPPPEQRLTVEHILQAGGKSFHGTNGEVLKVLRVSRESNGNYRIHIDFEDPSGGTDPLVAGAGRRALVMRGRPNGLAGNPAAMAPGQLQGADGWSLRDASGQSLSLIGREQSFFWLGNGLRYETTLVYTARNGQGNADRLVYFAPRTIQIDIPFTLHEVSLP
jgi:hypothetical protein